MKKRLKLLCASILMMSVITSSSCFRVNAATNSNGTNIELLGKNSIKYMTKFKGPEWNDVEIVNNRPLYDFNGKLIAHCLDFKNNITKEKAYIILNDDPEDEVISEFATGKYSPYTEQNIANNSTSIYGGILSYYSKSSANTKSAIKADKYVDIKTKGELDKSEVDFLASNAKNKKHKAEDVKKAKNLRNVLLSTNGVSGSDNSSESNTAKFYNDTTGFKILDVPDYERHISCTPTAAAMVIGYHKPLGQVRQVNKMIEDLAVAMETKPDSDKYPGTKYWKVSPGIIKVMNDRGINVNSWYEENKTSTYEDYWHEIENNNPVIVDLWASKWKGKYGHYETGFGEHSVAGVGYQYDKSHDAQYIIVHDTAVDGDVFCNFKEQDPKLIMYIYVHF